MPPLAAQSGFLPSFEMLLGVGAITYGQEQDPNKMVNAIFGNKPVAKPSQQRNKRHSTASPRSSYDNLNAFSGGFGLPTPNGPPLPAALRDIQSRMDYADPTFVNVCGCSSCHSSQLTIP